MSSIPTSPTSPFFKRRPLRLSSFDILHDASQDPYMSGTTNGTIFSRRSSRTSQTSFLLSPTTARPPSARSSRPSSIDDYRKSSSRLSLGSNISFDANENGLGNLADELEEALEDEYEVNVNDFHDSDYLDRLTVQSPHSSRDVPNDDSIPYPLSTTPLTRSIRPPALQSPSRTRSGKRKSKHQRIGSQCGGSDYGPGSGDEDGFSSTLIQRMGDIEALARTSVYTEDMLSEGGGVVRRTTHALKDLGPQAGIEANLTRIISAFTSMAAHRTNKTRDLLNQAHLLLYGNVLKLSEDAIDDVLSELETLSSTISFAQQQNPLLSLQLLASQTLDVAQTLRTLADALQESKIQANTATRKLKSVRDMVEDICTEQELVETSMMLIQAGDWDRRCKERQAAATCREVVLGFGDLWDLKVDDRPWMRKHEAIVS